MTVKMAYLFKIAFGGIAAIFGILVAVFGFWDVKNEDDQSSVIEWFHKKWEIINDSPWLTLPEKVINWAVKLKEEIPSLNKKYLDKIVGFPKRLVGSYILILPILCSFLLWGLMKTILGFSLYLVGFLGMTKLKKLSGKFEYFYAFLTFISMVIIVFKAALTTNIYLALIIMLFVMPMAFFMIFPIIFLGEISSKFNLDTGTENWLLNLSFVMVFSFFITFLAISLGHIIIPNGWIPQTLQMLISNVLLDGFTLMATLYILGKIVKPPYIIRIPLAIAVDLFVAAVFACASLYFGLVGTEQALTIPQILNVLMFKSPNGGFYEFGPFFWTMHTTFIPTVIYLFIILLCWLAKFMLQPAHLFFGWARVHNHPLRLTAALCGVFVAVFTVLSFAAATAEEKLKQDIKIQNNPVSTQLPP